MMDDEPTDWYWFQRLVPDLIVRDKLTQDDFHHLVLPWMETIERSGEEPDGDQLVHAGMLMAGSRWQDLDRRLVSWLAEAPSPRRVEIITCLLYGSWLRDKGPQPMSWACVEDFLRVSDPMALSDTGQHDYVLALGEALEGGGAPARLREAIAERLKALARSAPCNVVRERAEKTLAALPAEA